MCDGFPLTPLGLMAVVALTLLLITVGGPHQDRIVLALGTCGLAVITLLVLLVYATGCRSSRAGDDQHPIRVEAGARWRRATASNSPAGISWSPCRWRGAQPSPRRVVDSAVVSTRRFRLMSARSQESSAGWSSPMS